MNYLESLQETLDHQDIGIEQYIWVELQALGSSSFKSAPVIGATIRIKSLDSRHPDDLVYDFLNFSDHPLLFSMPFKNKFSFRPFQSDHAAYLSLDEVKEILTYCDRISTMKAFW